MFVSVVILMSQAFFIIKQTAFMVESCVSDKLSSKTPQYGTKVMHKLHVCTCAVFLLVANRLHAATVDQLTVLLESPETEWLNPEAAIHMWYAGGCRSKRSNCKIREASEDSETVSHTDQGFPQSPRYALRIGRYASKKAVTLHENAVALQTCQ